MTVRERLLTVRLIEKLKKHIDYTEQLQIEVTGKYKPEIQYERSDPADKQ